MQQRTHTRRAITTSVTTLAALALVGAGFTGTAFATGDHDGDADRDRRTSWTEDGDNRHASGKDRSVEHGKSGNNGCGNDDDFEDDNEGWCGHKPKKDHRPKATPATTSTTVKPAKVEKAKVDHDKADGEKAHGEKASGDKGRDSWCDDRDGEKSQHRDVADRGRVDHDKVKTVPAAPASIVVTAPATR